MKNFLTGLTIATAIAVTALLFMQFGGNKPTIAKSDNAKSIPTGNFKIAYFESDSIQNNFEYFKEIRSVLQTKDQTNSRQLNELKTIFTRKYQDLQKAAQSLSQAELANRQQELVQLEKTYQGKEQMMAQEMQDESFKKLQDVKKKIENFLKDYNKDHGYAYIFSSAPEFMYLKDSTYNITNELVIGLNKLYPKK